MTKNYTMENETLLSTNPEDWPTAQFFSSDNKTKTVLTARPDGLLLSFQKITAAQIDLYLLDSYDQPYSFLLNLSHVNRINRILKRLVMNPQYMDSYSCPLKPVDRKDKGKVELSYTAEFGHFTFSMVGSQYRCRIDQPESLREVDRIVVAAMKMLHAAEESADI